MRDAVIIFLVIIACGIVFDADASENDVKVMFGGFSHHIGAPDYADHNEKHNLVGISYNDTEIFFMKNSFHNDSVGIAHNFTYSYSQYVEFGFRVGAASGYDIDGIYNIGGIAPFVQPNMTVKYGNLGVELGYLPQFSHSTPYGAATLTFNWSL
ncbi:hypothetical protein vBValCWD615_10 [Vibrio phage vB_ValC_WD615]|nr:hypothetical protein vBValCWD615_10 [Vibrio phage vB_ValC_WD615]